MRGIRIGRETPPLFGLKGYPGAAVAARWFSRCPLGSLNDREWREAERRVAHIGRYRTFVSWQARSIRCPRCGMRQLPTNIGRSAAEVRMSASTKTRRSAGRNPAESSSGRSRVARHVHARSSSSPHAFRRCERCMCGPSGPTTGPAKPGSKARHTLQFAHGNAVREIRSTT